MAGPLCGDVSFMLACRLWGEVLVWGQHLSHRHIHSSCSQVSGAHLQVLLRAGLHHRVQRELGGQQGLQATRQAGTLGTRKDPWDCVVQQAAEPRHYHDVSTVHKHGCGGFISLEATQEKDGRLAEARRKQTVRTLSKSVTSHRRKLVPKTSHSPPPLCPNSG